MNNSHHFRNFINVIIVLSSIILAFESSLYNPHIQVYLYWLDFAVTVIYACEALTKIIACGFMFNGQFSYLRNKY